MLLEGVIDITLLMIDAEERRLVHENNFSLGSRMLDKNPFLNSENVEHFVSDWCFHINL